jgi:hypothetical protein
VQSWGLVHSGHNHHQMCENCSKLCGGQGTGFRLFLGVRAHLRRDKPPQRKVKKPVPYLPVNSFQNLEPYKSEMFCFNQIRILHEWKVHFDFRRTILCQGRLLTTAWRKFEKLIYIEYCSMYSSAPSCCGDHGEHLALCHNLPLLRHVNLEFNKVVH